MREAALVLFADRVDAGQRLARELGSVRVPDAVILGLRRGGVPVAAETLAEAAILACDWFTRYLLPADVAPTSGALR